ncbi:MAG: creatininase family protein [Pseudomonadota bacterium]
MPRPHRHFAAMTTTDFDTDTSDWVAVLPTAAIEQHGPHLPVGTDTMIGEGMVKTVLARLPDEMPVTFLPIQQVGKSNEHIDYPGTLTLTWETAIRAWVEIGESVARAGIKKLVFVNSHGGNTAMLDIITRELRVKCKMLAVHTAWFRFGDAGLADTQEAAIGIHGGTLETALIAHFNPDLVRWDRAQNFESAQSGFLRNNQHLTAHGPHAFAWKSADLNPAGVVGDASKATAAMGKTLAEAQADGFIALLHDVARTDLSVLK